MYVHCNDGILCCARTNWWQRGSGGDSGFGLGQIPDCHALRYPAHTRWDRNFSHGAGGNLAQIGHRNGVHSTDVVRHRPSLRHGHDCMTWRELQKRRLDRPEIRCTPANGAREQPTAEYGSLQAIPTPECCRLLHGDSLTQAHRLDGTACPALLRRAARRLYIGHTNKIVGTETRIMMISSGSPMRQ